MWTNIQSSLLTIARVFSPDAAWLDELADMTPNRFQGKRPADVLEQVRRYRQKLDALRQHSGLDPMGRAVRTRGPVTPSVVFLKSGQVLAAQAEWLVHSTDADLLISPFFRHHEFSSKTPSDVFGLVELANRRIDRILLGAGVGPTDVAP